MVNEGMSWSGSERNRCFLNTAGIRFANISATSGLDFLDDARAIATVDWDGDGDLDLFQVNRTGPQVRFLRNQWEHDHHWLALRLEGTRCNRDAIAARVELFRKGVSAPDIRTVRAGSSFLSQSSKAIHFGLGSETDIERVVVHWPGQESETFRNIRADRSYRLVQDSGRAEPLPSRKDPLRIATSAPQVVKPTEQGRAVLSSPVPIPKLSVKRLDGSPAMLAFGRQPTLLQLWASWCPMCQAEMHEFAERADDIQKAGVRVVAMSVDGLGEDTSSLDAAREAAERMRYPFTVGHGSEELLRKLEVLRGELFSNLTPFPVPTSFLLDDEGRLRIVYLGPMKVEQLLLDADAISASDEQWRELASPMRGRWFTEPKPIRLTNLAKAMAEAGFNEDAQWYRDKAAPQTALNHCSLALDLERQGKLRGALEQYKLAIKIDPNSARAYSLLGKFLMRRRQFDPALTALTNSVKLNPNDSDTHFNLGTLRVLRREIEAATTSYREAISVDPDHARAHASLGRLLQQEKRLADAVYHLKTAIQLDPTFAPPYVYLGLTHAQQNQPDDAIRLFKQALTVQPKLLDARVNLADLLVVRGDLDEALDHYRLALRDQPNAASIMGKLAWHLATRASAEKQSPREAVELAERLAQATEYRSAQALDILAASYADLQQYPEAAATLQKALALKPSPPRLAQEMRQRLVLYRDGKPYRIATER
jgi:tetratricopeptide (TPR) repeat protein